MIVSGILIEEMNYVGCLVGTRDSNGILVGPHLSDGTVSVEPY